MDVLREEYGIVPAGMLGHSAGEIPAGYADGCLTLRQVCAILPQLVFRVLHAQTMGR